MPRPNTPYKRNGFDPAERSSTGATAPTADCEAAGHRVPSDRLSLLSTGQTVRAYQRTPRGLVRSYAGKGLVRTM